MPKKKALSILDVTIRDGSYAINYQHTPDQVAAIASALDRAGIDYMEVGHGCGLGAGPNLCLPAAASDLQQIRAAKKDARRIRIGVIAGPAPVTLASNIDAVIDEVDFIRFGANCDAPRVIEENARHARKRRPKLALFLQLMRSTRRPKKVILEAARWAECFGFQTVYLVDTAGHFLPEEVGEIISTLTAKLSINIGFHGHDNLGLAVANTLAAIDAGATAVDASLKGMGRAGGNASLEALASLVRRKGVSRRIDFDALVQAGETLVAPIMPPQRSTAGLDIVTADANIDCYPPSLYEKISGLARVGLNEFIRELGKDSRLVEAGPNEIWRALTRLKIDPAAVFRTLGFPLPQASRSTHAQAGKKNAAAGRPRPSHRQ